MTKLSVRPPQPKDYVFLQTKRADGKPGAVQLLRVDAVNSDGTEVRGRLEKDPHLKSLDILAPTSDIILNAGKRPYPGKIHGHDMEKLFLKTDSHDSFGDVHLFTRLSEATHEQLWKGLTIAAKRLSSNGLSFLFDAPWVLEVTPQRGKYAGMFIPSKNLEKKPSRIHISASESTLQLSSLNTYSYVMLHEVGHLYHIQYLKGAFPKLNAEWIQLYAETVGPNTVTAAQCLSLGKRLLKNHGAGFAGLSDSLSDEDIEAMKLIKRWLNQVRSTTFHEMDSLLQVATPESLATFKDTWPTVDIHSKGLKPLVSQYACKNYKELFAESFAFYLLGQKLPKRVQTLMETSIGKASKFKAD